MTQPIPPSNELPSRATLLSWAQAYGFADIGITDTDLADYDPKFRAWLVQGFAGDMGYLERNVEKRLNPALLEPGTVRVICARMDYLAPDTQPLQVLEDSSKAYISRYALGRDYHKVLRRRLARLAKQIDAALHSAVGDTEHRYRAFTDSAPVLEKPLAEKAGLGWMGKHTLMLNKHAGSWFFLGEIFTNAPFALDAPTNPDGSSVNENGCGKCTACITVCPTDAIVSPNTLDARRCISYLTIEHKGSIPVELRAAMGNRVYGCDDCQLFCPWNRDAPHTTEEDFTPRHQLEAADLVALFELTEQEFLRITEGSAIRRINYEQWQRNLSIAIGNGEKSDRAIQALRNKRVNASEMVTEHIDWALARLNA